MSPTTAPGRVDSTKARVQEGITGADVGLLVLRLGLGVVFLGHGLQNFGWFPGGGYPTSISEQKAFLIHFGYSSPSLMAWLITATEIVAGVSLLLGLLMPLGAAAVIGIAWQFVAGLQWDGGLFGNDTVGGYEHDGAFLPGLPSDGREKQRAPAALARRRPQEAIAAISRRGRGPARRVPR